MRLCDASADVLEGGCGEDPDAHVELGFVEGHVAGVEAGRAACAHAEVGGADVRAFLLEEMEVLAATFLLQWCSSMPAAFVCRGVTGNTLADLKQMFSNSNMEFDESQSFMGGSTWIPCDCARVPAPDRGHNPVL